MPKKEVPLNALARYLPPGTYDDVLAYLVHYKVHLTVARRRDTILGDYRHKIDTRTHRISVNGNLNPFAFLVTLLHELAHLVTFEQYGNRVRAHGKEWKGVYGNILARFVEKKVFPADIEAELKDSLSNPGASACAEEGLQRILRRYDHKVDGILLLEQLPEGADFGLSSGRRFRKGKLRRTRYECKEVATGKLYLFSGLHEVIDLRDIFPRG